jgi:DNA-binding transcriptional regulator YdaS (Cro superfamily)
MGNVWEMTLTQFLSDAKLTDQAFAGLIGVSEFAVRKWRYGERTPRPKVMRRIGEVTGGKVTANDFVLHPQEAA